MYVNASLSASAPVSVTVSGVSSFVASLLTDTDRLSIPQLSS